LVRRRETTAVDAETSYTRSGDVNIAYQVVGDGPFDLVFVPGYVTHLETQWKISSFAPFLEELASFSRLIRFDKRGTGMSDRVSGAPTLETRMDDVRAVMDAAGSQRAAFYGLSEGAAMSILFAATYPERTAALVVRSAFPRSMWAHDYPWGRSDEEYERDVNRALQAFGTRERARESVRALGEFSDEETDAFLEMIRFGASPGAIEALHRMNKEIDVRHVLPAVRVPTLILRGSEDRLVPAEVADYMASSIPSARVVEIAGAGHLAFVKYQSPIISEIKSFLTEIWESGGWEEQEPDRVLATVLFTDIVGSSEKATVLGDRLARAARTAPCPRSPRAASLPGTRARHRRRRLPRVLRRTGTRDPMRVCDRRQSPRARSPDPGRSAHGRVRARRREGRRHRRPHRCAGRRAGAAG
jgi:pimeloyl-ACP methyl ester carboxylesterase